MGGADRGKVLWEGERDSQEEPAETEVLGQVRETLLEEPTGERCSGRGREILQQKPAETEVLGQVRERLFWRSRQGKGALGGRERFFSRSRRRQRCLGR